MMNDNPQTRCLIALIIKMKKKYSSQAIRTSDEAIDENANFGDASPIRIVRKGRHCIFTFLIEIIDTS